jgi:ABC-type nitrate/sulfonate/bicarbonate transport system permease component
MSTATATSGQQAAAPVVHRRLSPSSFGLGAGFVALLAGAILWEVLARVWDVSFFPPLSVVLVRLVELTAPGGDISEGVIVNNLVQSVINLIIGFSISAVAGVVIGALMGAYPKVGYALDVYVYALLTAPSLVFAPIFFTVFGATHIRETTIAVIVMYTVFIITVNTSTAIRSVTPSLIEMGRSFGASDRQMFRRVILPSALPLMMAGLRLGAGRAVKGMINGEMFIAIVGLGAVVINLGKRFDAAGVLAVLLVIVAVSLGAVKLVQIIDRRMTAWVPSTARQKR